MSELKKNYTIKKKLKGRCKIQNLEQTKKFKSYNKWITKKEKKNAIKYISKLNIPLLPNKKQAVIGTTKFLLPYFIYENKFKIFAVAPKKWTLEDNNNLIHTIGKLNEPIVRLVTTPKNLIDDNNKIRITGLELCILFKIYNYEIYEYNNKNYYGNIYFLIKKNNKIIIDDKYLKLINRKTKKIIYM